MQVPQYVDSPGSCRRVFVTYPKVYLKYFNKSLLKHIYVTEAKHLNNQANLIYMDTNQSLKLLYHLKLKTNKSEGNKHTISLFFEASFEWMWWRCVGALRSLNAGTTVG